jgi:hypothetical protein
MSEKKQYIAHSKEPTRTRSWQNNPDYDKFISDLPVSSLRFLQFKYKKEKKEFRNNFNIKQPLYLNEYMKLCKIEGMIDDEINNRMKFEATTNQWEEWFDDEKGVVFGESGVEKYAIAYTEDEDDIVYVNLNAKVSSECREEDDETDYEFYEPKDRKEKYAKWDYVKEIKEVTEE